MVPAQNALSLPGNPGMGTAWLPGELRLLQREKAGRKKEATNQGNDRDWKPTTHPVSLS